MIWTRSSVLNLRKLKALVVSMFRLILKVHTAYRYSVGGDPGTPENFCGKHHYLLSLRIQYNLYLTLIKKNAQKVSEDALNLHTMYAMWSFKTIEMTNKLGSTSMDICTTSGKPDSTS